MSGGQTGVDRAALDFALENGIDCGGWCPKGRLAEDGAIPVRYPLIECDDSRYKVRTEKNVFDSDATLILNLGRLSAGTALTARLASKFHRPLLVLDLSGKPRGNTVLSWIEINSVKTLNIAGPRESQRRGIEKLAYAFLRHVWVEPRLGAN